jgi:hypothetical protein
MRVTETERLIGLAEEIREDEQRLFDKKAERDDLLAALRDSTDLSVQQLADLAGMRREGAHYAIMRAQARRGRERA